MQKVVGSSPIIRFKKKPRSGASLSLRETLELTWRSTGSALGQQLAQKTPDGVSLQECPEPPMVHDVCTG